MSEIVREFINKIGTLHRKLNCHVSKPDPRERNYALKSKRNMYMYILQYTDIYM